MQHVYCNGSLIDLFPTRKGAVRGLQAEDNEQEEIVMLKFLGGTVGIIFIIGLIVVIGILSLIF